MNRLASFFKARLPERSSWTGMSASATAMGAAIAAWANVSPYIINGVAVFVVVCGIAAFLTPEKKADG